MSVNAGRLVPVWRRVTVTEQRLLVTLAVLAMSALQTRVPEHLSLFRWWILPVVQTAILIGVIAANPGRVDQSRRRLRLLSLLLIAVASLANAWAAASLIVGLVQGTKARTGRPFCSPAATSGSPTSSSSGSRIGISIAADRGLEHAPSGLCRTSSSPR